METAGPMADENTWEMPEALRRRPHPRRDRPGAWPEVRIETSAVGRVRELVDGARPEIEDILALPGTAPAFAEHGRAYLKGDADPLGAAVVASVAVSGRGLPDRGGKTIFTDAWAAEHGLPFAACAFALAGEIATSYRQTGAKRTWTGVRAVTPVDHYGGWWAAGEPARHLRSLLAAADDDVYAEAVERLAHVRGTPLQKTVVSYLVPTRQDWVEEVCSLAPAMAPRERYHLWMLYCSLGSPDQVARIGAPLGFTPNEIGAVGALVDGAGAAAAVPLLTEALDDEYLLADTERLVLDILAVLPADEAFQALLDRAGRRHAPAALTDAAKRYPARALRLLAGAAREPAVKELLRAHLIRRPDVADALLPELAEPSRAAIEEIRAAAVRLPEAPAGALPPLLADPPWTRPQTGTKPVVRIPVAPDWADVRLLPQVLLRDRSHALPDAAARHVVAMLAMSKPGDAYAGLDAVREACDRESLAEFGWALFQQWRSFGAPPKEGWALTQLGLTGDDGTVRRLAPVIRAWPGDGGHARAVTGLDVLAAIGTDVALMHLHAIAQRVKFKGLKSRAQKKIEEVAAGLELTADQLADRLVPDFGLDAAGSMTLDYGPRRFTVGFDDQLEPYVADGSGRRRKALPKPGADDDAELAPAAYKAFSTLKKDVRTVAADQLRRLETCMVTRRRWPVGEFGELLAGHPLLGHIVRRLVWLAEDGGETISFRVAEDGTFADSADDARTLPDSCDVGVAHPVDLDGSLGAWAEVFADYEILQPFPQLGRPVHRLTGAERASGRLERFEGLTVPVGRVLGLTSRGWNRGEPQDAGVECWISRRLPGGRYIVIDLAPGIAAGAVDALPDQMLRTVALAGRPDEFRMRGGATVPFFGLDPVTASEILTDLATLT